MKVISFETLTECKDAIKKINKSMGYPNENTLTWDEPHKTIKGEFVLSKPENQHLKNVVGYIETTIKRSDLIGELPSHLKVNEASLTLKTSNKYFLLKRVDDFKEMSVEITFLINGEKQSFKVNASQLTPSKNGYSIDVDSAILSYVATL